MMIEIRELTKSFNRSAVLDGVSLEIPRGNRVALVGANGAGKTTLIRCLLGEYSHGGTIHIAGRAPRMERTSVLRAVGFVPQLPPPLRMPVDQLLQFAANLCGTGPAGMEEVATRLGLDVGAVRRQPFAKLSGGQKQKLLIAVALGRKTHLLIMDEPAANLDPDARRAFFSLLAERHAETTMLISSHRLDEVSAIVDRVVELDQGRVALDDHVADAAGLASQLWCRLELRRPEMRLAQTLEAWGLTQDEAGRVWQGTLPAGDRLRFLGMVSRYTGLFQSVHLEDEALASDRASEVPRA